MNWRRGLFRLWLFAMPFWFVGWVYLSDLLCLQGFANHCRDNRDLSVGDWIVFASVLVAIPVIALGLGNGLFWMVEGFRKDHSN
jgi:hypothetical protein